MKEIDFTKKIVCSDPAYTVDKVIPVNFRNPIFKHSLVVNSPDGTQFIVTVSDTGMVASDSEYRRVIEFMNPEPEVVNRYYVNIYPSMPGSEYRTFVSARVYAYDDVKFILEVITYDDGRTEANLIPFTKE